MNLQQGPVEECEVSRRLSTIFIKARQYSGRLKTFLKKLSCGWDWRASLAVRRGFFCVRRCFACITGLCLFAMPVTLVLLL